MVVVDNNINNTDMMTAADDGAPPEYSVPISSTTRVGIGSSSRFANDAVGLLSTQILPLTTCNLTILRPNGGRLSVVQNGAGQCRQRVMQPVIAAPDVDRDHPLEPPPHHHHSSIPPALDDDDGV
eukprot:TRINITY_DN27629_c0_g1_i2.p1 TRINITY_DN27629_c0_g1~~TRINITY_DN27629_c0_g1_i2.p1  ORF type:complete len:125 (+),score=13.08 TRINITY_DN27629_c0_g1_i2:232-606(+)